MTQRIFPCSAALKSESLWHRKPAIYFAGQGIFQVVAQVDRARISEVYFLSWDLTSHSMRRKCKDAVPLVVELHCAPVWWSSSPQQQPTINQLCSSSGLARWLSMLRWDRRLRGSDLLGIVSQRQISRIRPVPGCRICRVSTRSESHTFQSLMSASLDLVCA